MEQENNQGHSENHFGAYRDFWWNKGFLDLMAERLRLAAHQSMLDVGCGKCHWSKLLVPYLSEPADVYAVDNDPKWSRKDAAIQDFFKIHGASLQLMKADASDLPFKDDCFDIVTCQTLLIHVADPAKVISEMKRVLKPGGTILCAEPNNIIQKLIKNSLSTHDSIDTMLDHVKYALIYEEGKKRMGQGDNSLGDLLPGMLAIEGFRHIEVKISDKAIPIYPPYTNQEQTATLHYWAEELQGDGTDKKYFEAAGEKYVSFYEDYQKKYLHTQNQIWTALKNEEYHTAGAVLMYLISAVK